MIELTKDKSEFPFISIVVCTYNRITFLKKCLKSLHSIDYPRSKFKIIVVDGESTDGTVTMLSKEFPLVKYIIQDRPGLAAARNIGAEMASGTIVAYTDDDCTVDSKWLESIVEAFSFSNNIMCVCGPVFPLTPEIIPDNLFIKSALGLFEEGKKIKFIQGLVTSNSAFRKEIFKRIQFNEYLGVTRKRGFLFSGEDDVIARALIKADYKILYNPCAIVFHHIPIERLRVPYFIKRAAHGGISRANIYLEENHSRVKSLRYSFSNLAQSLLNSITDRSFNNCLTIVYYFFIVISLITFIDLIINRITYDKLDFSKYGVTE